MAASGAASQSFGEYTFDLSERLRQAARSTLAQLEASINQDGYNWLEDYLDNVKVQQGRRAPIADLIKTPSRTATAKKTRAAVTATINRAEQIKAFNARLVLSPLADRSPAGRQPLSPLQVQSINSPRRLGVSQPQSPTKSPLSGKAPAPLELKLKGKEFKTKSAAEPKPKGKGRGKAKADAENMDIDEEEKPLPKKRGRPKKNAALTESTLSTSSTASRPLRSAAPKSPLPEPAPQLVEPDPEPAPAVVPELQPEANREPEPEPETEPDIMVAESEAAVDPPVDAESAAENVAEPIAIDEDMAEEQLVEALDDCLDEETMAVEADKEVVAPEADTDVEDSEDDADDDLPATISPSRHTPGSPSPVKKAASVKMLSPAKDASPVRQPSPVKEVSPVKTSPVKVSPVMTAPVQVSPVKASPVRASSVEKEPSPMKESSSAKDVFNFKASSPVKDVSPAKASSPLKRSSPIKEGLYMQISPVKKVSAPTRHVRSSWLNQALGNRPIPAGKSSASSLRASMKRKSEEGPGADGDDGHDRRAEKVARFDDQPTDAATGRPASPVHSSIFSARQPGSATSLPASANAATPSAATRPNPTSVPHDRFNKHNKVHSALEDLRERTAAAAAAKQKSAAANKLANTTKAPIPTSTGGGFLRGLGGLFGLSGPAPEDDVTRLRREAEDRHAQLQAEADLARLMRDFEAEDSKNASKAADKENVVADFERTPKLSKPATVTDDSSQTGDVAIVVDDGSEADDESEDDERDASITLPEFPTPDIGDEYIDEPYEDGPASAIGAAGINLPFESSSPPRTPPLKIKKAGSKSKVPMPAIVVSPPPKEDAKPRPKRALGPAVRTNISRPPTAASTYDDEDEEMDEEDTVRYGVKKTPASGVRVAPGSSSRLSKSNSTLSQAERIAAKALGVKSAVGPVKSIQMAAEAAKKEESVAQRKAAMRAQIELRKQEEARRKEEAERQAAEEERKRKAAEMEERRKRIAEAEKRRAQMALQAQKDRAAREEREAAEEEAARKRKMAAFNKSQQAPGSTIKRIVPSSVSKQPLRPSKVGANYTTPAKSGPSMFRTNEEQSSTIKLVGSSTNRVLGNPVRTSTTASQYSAQAALQQKRQTLQAQLEQKVGAAEVISEDIDLPDIASEYSDSDDSDKETTFQRPAWAESPELKQALERQAHLNPDELFGAIRPLNMDELFRQRQGKFRARTSSANWSGADRLTEAEEREYARRMGFRPLNAPRDGGGSAGDR